MKPSLKIVTPELDGPRSELRDAIADVQAAQRTAATTSEAAELARGRLREKERAHFSATSALEEAQAPRKSLAQRLAAACDDDERWRISAEHEAEAGRPPVTVEDLRKLRQAVEAADDEVVVARNAVETAEAQARPAASALSRAKDRRQKAIYEVVRPEVGRLMRETQMATEALIAVRAALNFVANGPLTDSYSNDRRHASMLLSRFSFPSEQGLRTEDDLTKRDAAIARWQAFAQRITQDASAELPTG